MHQLLKVFMSLRFALRKCFYSLDSIIATQSNEDLASLEEVRRYVGEKISKFLSGNSKTLLLVCFLYLL